MNDIILKENKELRKETKELDIKDLIKGLTESQTVMNYAFAGFKTETEQKFQEVDNRLQEHDEIIKKKIYLSSNENRILMLSDENKEISAKNILKFLDYKKENTYELEELSEDISNLDENNKNYIEQIYFMIQSIIIGINNIQQ